MRGFVWALMATAPFGCGGRADTPDEPQQPAEVPATAGDIGEDAPSRAPEASEIDLGPCEMQPGQYAVQLSLAGAAVCTLDPYVYECTPGERLECPPGPEDEIPPIAFASGDNLGVLAAYGACDASSDGCGVTCVGAQLSNRTTLLEVQIERESATSASGTTHLDLSQDLLPCEYELTLTLMP